MAKEPSPGLALILGPNHPGKRESTTSAWKQTGIPFTILGDGVNPLERYEIFVALRSSTQETHIHFWGHGGIDDDSHQHTIDIVLDLNHTKKLLAEDRDIPGTRHVWSCYAGAAKNAVTKLDENRPLILHSNAKNTTLVPMNSEGIIAHGKFYQEVLARDKRPPNAYDAFEFSFLTSPETVVFSELVRRKIQSVTKKAPKKAVNDDGLARYLQASLHEFREFRKEKLGHTEEQFLSMDAWMAPQIRQHYLEHALIIAINRGNSERASGYLNIGINPNATLNDGTTPLITACVEGDVKTIKQLLAHPKIAVNQAESGGTTPLITACTKGNIETVKQLLAHPNIAVNQAENDGTTPLIAACIKGNAHIVNQLLEKGADIRQTGPEGITPLIAASQEGHTEIIDLLLATKKVDINKDDTSGTTALYFACLVGHTNAIKQLLAEGADLTKGTYGTFTPLMAAALTGQEGAIDELLLHVNDLKYLSQTAITSKAEAFCQERHITLEEDNRPFLEKTAAELARLQGHESIAQKIEARKNELERKDKPWATRVRSDITPGQTGRDL